MEGRESNDQEQAGRRFVPAQRLPYRSPALVEYGNVSKLTEGATGSMVDANAMAPQRGCL